MASIDHMHGTGLLSRLRISFSPFEHPTDPLSAGTSIQIQCNHFNMMFKIGIGRSQLQLLVCVLVVSTLFFYFFVSEITGWTIQVFIKLGSVSFLG